MARWTWRGLGCLGILAGFAVVALALVWQGPTIFSPGPLSAQRLRGDVLGGVRSHADLEEQCSRCHLPWKPQGLLCLECHDRIEGELQSRTALHARFPEPLRCQNCHPDHRGREADLLTPALQRFDHELTRFSLRRHRFRYDLTAMACTDCHTRWPVDQGAPITQQCMACHRQAEPEFMANHIALFGNACLECHDGRDTMAAFDHSQTGFPLEGRHQEVACEACHVQGRFAGTPTSCNACHEEPDVHRGLFAATCQECHTPAGWSPVLWQGRSFDHARDAGFSLARHRRDPLTGEAITCVACHEPQNLNRFRGESCQQCHEARAPEFMAQHVAQVGPVCLQCHDGVDRMRAFDHNRVFPLVGGHAGVACTACHQGFRFTGTPASCANCHQEPEFHRDLFGQQCEYCHTVEAWSPAALRVHRFPLDHGGASPQACAVCHTGNRYVAYTCYRCHEHTPEGIRRTHLAAGIPESQLAQCVACHPGGRVEP